MQLGRYVHQEGPAPAGLSLAQRSVSGEVLAFGGNGLRPSFLSIITQLVEEYARKSV